MSKMRIISGIYKGRVIKAPEGIRPTQNKVRKAVFDILQDINGFSFLELFAGSGAVGIEALSKGAKETVFVEKDPRCVKIINANLNLLSCGKGSRVLGLDVEEAITRFYKDRKKFDIVFFDPPYYKAIAKKILLTLSTYDIVAPNGFVIAQHFKKDNLPDILGDLVLFKQKIYGDTVLSFYSALSNK